MHENSKNKLGTLCEVRTFKKMSKTGGVIPELLMQNHGFILSSCREFALIFYLLLRQ